MDLPLSHPCLTDPHLLGPSDLVLLTPVGRPCPDRQDRHRGRTGEGRPGAGTSRVDDGVQTQERRGGVEGVETAPPQGGHEGPDRGRPGSSGWGGPPEGGDTEAVGWTEVETGAGTDLKEGESAEVEAGPGPEGRQNVGSTTSDVPSVLWCLVWHVRVSEGRVSPPWEVSRGRGTPYRGLAGQLESCHRPDPYAYGTWRVPVTGVKGQNRSGPLSGDWGPSPVPVSGGTTTSPETTVSLPLGGRAKTGVRGTGFPPRRQRTDRGRCRGGVSLRPGP